MIMTAAVSWRAKHYLVGMWEGGMNATSGNEIIVSSMYVNTLQDKKRGGLVLLGDGIHPPLRDFLESLQGGLLFAYYPSARGISAARLSINRGSSNVGFLTTSTNLWICSIHSSSPYLSIYKIPIVGQIHAVYEAAIYFSQSLANFGYLLPKDRRVLCSLERLLCESSYCSLQLQSVDDTHNLSGFHSNALIEFMSPTKL